MENIVYCNGFNIYKAAVAGAKCGYNRSTDDHQIYVAVISECYDEMIADFDDAAVQQQILRNTNGDWRQAKLPLCLAMLHHHKHGTKCETHARVYLGYSPARVFDIPLSHWQRLSKESEKNMRKRAA